MNVYSNSATPLSTIANGPMLDFIPKYFEIIRSGWPISRYCMTLKASNSNLSLFSAAHEKDSIKKIIVIDFIFSFNWFINVAVKFKPFHYQPYHICSNEYKK